MNVTLYVTTKKEADTLEDAAMSTTMFALRLMTLYVFGYPKLEALLKVVPLS